MDKYKWEMEFEKALEDGLSRADAAIVADGITADHEARLIDQSREQGMNRWLK